MVTAIVSSAINCLITSYPRGLFLGRAPQSACKRGACTSTGLLVRARERVGTSRCALGGTGVGADSSALLSSPPLSSLYPSYFLPLLFPPSFSLPVTPPTPDPPSPPLFQPSLPLRTALGLPAPAHPPGTQLQAAPSSRRRQFQPGREGGAGRPR